VELIRCGAAALLGAALAVAALSDLAWRIIPNGCVASVALSWLLVCGSGEKVAERLAEGVAGALAALLLMLAALLLMLAAARLGVALGRGAGVGGGDVKLLSASALWTGPVWGLALVGASCAVGLCAHGVAWLARRAFRPDAAAAGGIPLGPSIAVCLLVFVLGP